MNQSTVLRRLVFCGAAATLLLACSDDADPGLESGAEGGADTGVALDGGSTTDAAASDASAESAPTYYEVVKPIFDAHCAGCHVEGGVGPFPMTTYAEVAALAPAIADSITRGSMPPWDAGPIVEYLYDPSLNEDQIAAVLDWAEAGAPEGNADREGDAIELELGQLSRVDVTVGLDAPYTPETRPDEYRCFVLDWPYEESVWITGFRADPTAMDIAHHALVWYVPETFAGSIDEADGTDGRAGYDCFGSAAPTGGEDFPSGIFGAWAPGTDGYDYPEGTGQQMNPGDRLVLQMHYSVAAGSASTDNPTVSFSVEEDVELRAGSLAHFDFEWYLRGSSMAIPAGDDHVEHSYSGAMATSPLIELMMPEADVSRGLRIYGVIPHLHQIGTSLTLEVERPDGTILPIVDIADWDFNWQRQYFLAEPIDITADDIVHLRCSWDNSPGNQPMYNGEVREPLDVGWGDGSFDEMCLGLFFVSEIPAE